MGAKRKLNLRNDVKVNIGIPISLHGEFEELFVIEKRKRKGKLLKRDFIIEVIKMGIRSPKWLNK
tara:strand:- start:546 stop:740 length:195 start_codon:yes stop_codon:yes gene_type:complete